MALGPGGWNRTPDRPWNLPGLNRDNAASRPIEQGLIQRIAGNVRGWMGMGNMRGGPESPFFPPGRPLDPIAPGAAGRRTDYPTNYNAIARPRSYEPIDFETLRAISDPSVGGYDLIRLAIETRKDQMSKLQFSVLPRKQPNENARPKSTSQCTKLEEMFRRPDGVTAWQQWCSQLIEEHLVIDAPAIYRRRSQGGDTIRLELLDGATIKPLLNYDGRRPEHGAPAYQQILKGVQAVDYTADELIYVPRNPRVHKFYGYSCVEQVLVTVNIGLRRQAGQLGFFTDGNVPDAISQVPATWSVAQIQEFQDYWDSMVNDVVRRRKMRFVPSGVQLQMTRADNALVDQFDEWLARIIAYCFSLPPTPFVRMVNRATAENAYEMALDEGLQPLMIWLKGILDYIIANWFGEADLEIVWDDIKKTDPAEKESRDLAMIQQGVISRDDMRAERGLEPLGLPAVVSGIGPLGFMSIEAMKKAIDNGWDLTGMPQPGMGPEGDVGAMGGDPSLIGSGQPGDPLVGMPPEILQALGIDPAGAGATPPDGVAPDTNVVKPGSNATPAPGESVGDGNGGGNVVPIHKHPAVQAALKHGDRTAHQLAARMASAGR